MEIEKDGETTSVLGKNVGGGASIATMKEIHLVKEEIEKIFKNISATAKRCETSGNSGPSVAKRPLCQNLMPCDIDAAITAPTSAPLNADYNQTADGTKPSSSCGTSPQSLNESMREFPVTLEWMQHITRELAIIRDSHERMLGMMQAIHDKITGTTTEETVQRPKQFPLNSREDYKSIQLQLKDNELRCKTVKYFGTLGGRSVADVVRRILAGMIGPDLARQINWSGKNEKENFSESELFRIVAQSTRKNQPAKNASEHEIIRTTIDWFRGSADRIGGRRRSRMKNESGKRPLLL